jgi:hypothetical protein
MGSCRAGFGGRLQASGLSRRALGNRAEAAFTFAEILAAMVFMAIVIPVAMNGIQIANRAGVVAARKTVAIQLADRLLNETIVTTNTITAGQSGTFPDPYKDYRWRQSKKNWTEDTTMREISVEVFYTVQDVEYSVFLATLVSQDTQ